MFPKLSDFSSWTLFLDRDGVINKKIPDDYIKSWDEFEFLPSVKESIAIFNKFFGRIIVISNQQGIGKGIMKEADLKEIHRKMCKEIELSGGFIDKVYFCPDLAGSNSPNRKPQSGMALQAKSDFPQIEFNKTIMIGDSPSDMEFAKKIGVYSVFLGNDSHKIENNKHNIDFVFINLKEFADFVYENNHH